ncbi:formyl transferase [Cladochytrium replicatum]|nr:formyl transferase [Cladochytrium replicatum]
MPHPNHPFRVLFFGSSHFAIPSLRRLMQCKESGELVTALEVVTAPDNKQTKIPEVPLKTFSRKAGIPVHVAPPKTLRNWQRPILSETEDFDLGVVVSFGYFLPKSLITSFRYGALNVHPSLLPRHRGPAPIEHTILNQDTKAGVSIIELHHDKFDAGRILLQSEIDVRQDAKYLDLHDQLAELGASELIRTIRDLDLRSANALSQDDSLSTHAPKIRKEQANINWNTATADQVYLLHRALGYRVPIHSTFRGKRVQILEMVPTMGPTGFSSNEAPGILVYSKERGMVFVRCSEGWIGCTQLKVQDRNVVNAVAFMNGYQVVNGQDKFVQGDA